MQKIKQKKRKKSENAKFFKSLFVSLTSSLINKEEIQTHFVLHQIEHLSRYKNVQLLRVASSFHRHPNFSLHPQLFLPDFLSAIISCFSNAACWYWWHLSELVTHDTKTCFPILHPHLDGNKHNFYWRYIFARCNLSAIIN